MIKLARITLFLTVVFTLLTLARDFPPYRVYLLDLALIPCLFAVLLQRLTLPATTRFVWQKIDSLMIVLLFLVTLSLIFSEKIAQSVVTYFDWLRIVLVYFAARMLMVRVLTERMLRRLMFFCGGLLLMVGLIQLVTGTSFGLIGNYFGAGLDQSVAANVEGVGSRTRISGTTSNPIVFAMWVTLFSLIMASHFNARRNTLLFVGVTVIAAGVVLSTLSRGAIAAFAVSWLIFVFINRRQLMRNVVAGVVLLLFTLPLAFLGLQQSVLGQAAEMLQARIEKQELLQEDSGRVQVFKMGATLISEPKVFFVGTGPDNMVLAYNNYTSGMKSSSYRGESYQRSGVHNIWMKMFVEYGFGAVLVFVLIWVGVWRRSLRLWAKRNEDISASIWGGFFVSFLIPYWLLDAMVYESAMSYHLYIPVFLLIAFLVSRTQVESRKRFVRAPRNQAAGRAGR